MPSPRDPNNTHKGNLRFRIQHNDVYFGLLLNMCMLGLPVFVHQHSWLLAEVKDEYEEYIGIIIII